MPDVDPKNRLNDLSSREWLPFQKSWFALEKNPLPDFISFFTKTVYPDGHTGTVAVYPETVLREVDISSNGRDICNLATLQQPNLDYVYLDFTEFRTMQDLQANRAKIQQIIRQIEHALRDRAYMTIAAKNWHSPNGSELVAWEIANIFRACFQQKDEKIGCLHNQNDRQSESQNGWAPRNSVTYFLQFRKEKEFDNGLKINYSKSTGSQQNPADVPAGGFRDAWYVHRPPRREKGVLLHPAKFPEDLIERYIKNFTKPGEVVLDPMAGTGSTLIAALACERMACGIELNPDFVEISRQRFSPDANFQLVIGDAADENSYTNLPVTDYCITSPPYWDMLRMRGSETQKKRKKAGLQRWYSEDPKDAGNIENYAQFIDQLKTIYHRVAMHLKPGGYLTVIVKNVKKQGKIYPLAWDITAALMEDYIFCGEQFWCQDDQRLAPFGYRYAWVSNTFHHYCLTFRRR